MSTRLRDATRPPGQAVEQHGRADQVPAPLLVVASIASVQIGSALARTIFDDVGATTVTLMRLGFASLLLLTVLRPKPWHWSREALRAAILLGVAMAGMNVAFYLSLRTVPLGVAVTIEFLGPLLLSLAQTRHLRDVVWVSLAGAGVALLGLQGGHHVPPEGLALALLAGAFWAAYILASARVGRLVPGVQGLAVAMTVSTLIALPLGVSGLPSALRDPAVLGVGLAVAVLSSIIPYGCELAALRRIPTRVFGVLMSLEPAAAALAGLLLLGQTLGSRELVALLMVSVASIGVTLGRRRDADPQSRD
jgi:inner membrane transporter RhtA